MIVLNVQNRLNVVLDMTPNLSLKLLDQFEDVLKDLKVPLGEGSPVKKYIDVLRQFRADKSSLTMEDLNERWKDRFEDFYSAQIVVGKLAVAVVTLKSQPRKRLREPLEKILAGSLAPDFEPGQAKDFFYELELASVLLEAGFDVELREPDIVVQGGGLGESYAIACKYPSSLQQIPSHLSKGYNQIKKQGMPGFVSVGLDLIVFEGFGKFLDFRKSTCPPLVLLGGLLREATDKLIEQQKVDYPSEPQVDGLMLTLTPGGIYSVPTQTPGGVLSVGPGLVSLFDADVRCEPGNPLHRDLGLIREKIVRLNDSIGIGSQV